MNRRLLSFILCILLFLNIGSAVDLTKNGTQSTPSDVIFNATPFVRIGFSSIPVTTAVEPQDSLKRNSASFSGSQGVIPTTGVYYLYAQAFTTSQVKVTVDSVSPLTGTVVNGGQETNEIYHWNLKFTPYGNETGLPSVSVNSSNFSSGEILNESALNLTEDDRKYPRSYCWGFNVSLNDDYDPPAKPGDNGEICVTISTI